MARPKQAMPACMSPFTVWALMPSAW